MPPVKIKKKILNGTTLNYLYFNRLDSTQNFAQRICHSRISEQEWYCIVADKQTNSRGIKGLWLSFCSNILVTYTFKLHKNNMQVIHNMQFIAALSIIELLNNFCSKISFKWPNDVYVKQKKIAGILTEIETNNFDRNYYNIYLGIGINVHVNQNQLSKITEYPCTSLSIETNRKYNIHKMIDDLSEKITLHTQNNIINQSNPINLIRPYLEKFDNQHIQIQYKQNNATKYENGKIIDIDNSGKLIFLKSDQTTIHLSNCKINLPKV